MNQNTYFRKNFTPSMYLLMKKFRGQTKIGDYVRVLRDGLIPGRLLCSRLVCVMTTWCTLKCRDCNNLMPCYEKPYHLDADAVLADIDAFLDRTDTLTELELIGGEPFIYPELSKVLTKVLSDRRILFVSLTSNGTVVPADDILRILAAGRVRVELSDYGAPTQKLDEVTAAFDRYGILYDRNTDLSWVAPGPVEKRGKSVVQMAKEYRMCFSFRYCNTLLKGRVYHCSRAAHLSDLGYADLSDESFDVHGSDSGRDALKKYWLMPYTKACDHCDHGLKKKVKAAVQTEAKLKQQEGAGENGTDR